MYPSAGVAEGDTGGTGRWGMGQGTGGGDVGRTMRARVRGGGGGGNWRVQPAVCFMLHIFYTLQTTHAKGYSAHLFYRGRTVRCAKSRLFSTTGSHGSQAPEFCTLHPPPPVLVHQGLFFF